MFTAPVNNAYYSLVDCYTTPSDEYPGEMHYVTYTIGIHLGSSTPTYKVSTGGDAFYRVVGDNSGTTNSGKAYDLYLTIDTLCRITEDRPRPATGDQIRFNFEAIT